MNVVRCKGEADVDTPNRFRFAGDVYELVTPPQQDRNHRAIASSHGRRNNSTGEPPQDRIGSSRQQETRHPRVGPVQPRHAAATSALRHRHDRISVDRRVGTQDHEASQRPAGWGSTDRSDDLPKRVGSTRLLLGSSGTTAPRPRCQSSSTDDGGVERSGGVQPEHGRLHHRLAFDGIPISPRLARSPRRSRCSSERRLDKPGRASLDAGDKDAGHRFPWLSEPPQR